MRPETLADIFPTALVLASMVPYTFTGTFTIASFGVVTGSEATTNSLVGLSNVPRVVRSSDTAFASFGSEAIFALLVGLLLHAWTRKTTTVILIPYIKKVLFISVYLIWSIFSKSTCILNSCCNWLM